MGFLGAEPKQRFGSFAAESKGTRSEERNISVPKGHKSSAGQAANKEVLP